MRMIPIAIVIAAIAAPGAARNRGQVPEATPTGKPQNCVTISRIRTTHVRNDSVIDFEMNGGQVYRNTLPYACPGLGFDQAFGHETHTGELCSIDTITVIRAGLGTPGPTCGLGIFQPVKLVKK